MFNYGKKNARPGSEETGQATRRNRVGYEYIIAPPCLHYNMAKVERRNVYALF